MAAVAVRTHLCASCKEQKPMTDFRRVNGKGWVDDDGYRRHSYCQPCARERGRLYQQRSRARGVVKKSTPGEKRPDTRKRDFLDPAPFKLWLTQKVAEYGTRDRVAAACQLAPRRVYAVLNDEQEHVSLDVVDWALTREGSTFLFELYGPELYPGLDVQAFAETLRGPSPAALDEKDNWTVPNPRDEVIA